MSAVTFGRVIDFHLIFVDGLRNYGITLIIDCTLVFRTIKPVASL